VIPTGKCIWQNGALVPWAQATTHVLAHALHYGSSVFEGIRVYDTERGSVFFRLDDHLKRLFASARIYRMEVPFDLAAVRAACHRTVASNELRSAYVRPLVYCGYGSMSLDPAGAAIDVVVAAIDWGLYLGAESKTRGVDACTASWQRLPPNTLPMLAKAGGNYLSGQLIACEAHRNGYAEGIALDAAGMVSEGSGQNLFAVRDGVLLTPPASSSILPGITRDTVLQFAAEEGIPVRVEPIPRELLLLADEVFLCGTASEITPVRSLDKLPIGNGARGEVTARLQRAFDDLLAGRRADPHGWCVAVEPEGPA
jgi:branched-chain amino acid aminotransferase